MNRTPHVGAELNWGQVKHIPDPRHWAHEGSFVCKRCKQRINFSWTLEGYDGPDDCPQMELPTMELEDEQDTVSPGSPPL
jgi:hypothetical protein